MKGFKRKEKKQKGKVPKEKKKVNGKVFARVLWAVILIWIGLSVFSFMRMSSLSVRNSVLEKEVQTLQTNTKNVNLLNQDSSLDLFLKRYATNYLTMSDSEDQMKNRKKILESMSARDIEYDDKKLNEGSQSLVSIAPYEFEFHKKYDLAIYNVTYRLTVGEKETTYSVALNLPVKRENGKKYLVVAEPFVTSFDINDLSGSGDRLESDFRKEEEISESSDLENIQVFLEQFLTMYQEGNIDQLNYLMEDPEGLNGQYEVILDSFQAYGLKKKPVVDVHVRLKQKDVDVLYNQQMQLKLETKDGKYFIKSFSQVIN
ncbi:conjugal transfer protein [Enterococcus faecalis]|uniref:conjugal transfer protein n=1 Tax=Enterococcus faecalis TaxID=1351 RepID=UPI001E342224|nr:conjugal transfer protein [Enterococcus faecalis]MCD4978455.1 conjugal transfer protein [Enterococcus faecalis]